MYTKQTLDTFKKENSMGVFDKQVGGNHYQKFGIQPTVFLQANQDMLGWCESNAIKYACRHKFKNGRQDIEKAIHYLQMVLEKDYPDEEVHPDAQGPSEDIQDIQFKLLPAQRAGNILDALNSDNTHYETKECSCPRCMASLNHKQQCKVATCDDCEEWLGKDRCHDGSGICPRLDEIDTAKRLKQGGL